MILGVRGALAPVWGRVSKLVSKRSPFDAKRLTHLGAIFRNIRLFLTLDFSFIFEVTSDSELRHFGAQKERKRRFLGRLFGAISRLVAKVRMKLPSKTPAPF